MNDMTKSERWRYALENWAYLFLAALGLKDFGGHPGLIGQVLAVYIIRAVLFLLAAVATVAVVLTRS